MKIKISVQQATETHFVPALRKLCVDIDNTPDRARYLIGRTLREIDRELKKHQEAQRALFGKPHGVVCLARIDAIAAEIEAAKAAQPPKRFGHLELAIKKLENQVAMYTTGGTDEPLIVEDNHPERAKFDERNAAILGALIETEIEDGKKLVIKKSTLTGDEMTAVDVLIAFE